MATPTTRWRQVKASIADALSDGRWKHGEALPGETTLARDLDVSLGTLRKAMDELVAERILVRQQGRGTFVASHTRDYMLNVFFTIAARDGTRTFPETELLAFGRGRADVTTARALQIDVGTPIYRIATLLRLDGKPVIVDHLRLPVARFPGLTERAFLARDTTVYGLYQARYGISVVRTEEAIEAALASAQVRKHLRMEPPAPVLRIVRTAYTWRDTPVDTRVRYVRTTGHRYLSRLGAG